MQRAVVLGAGMVGQVMAADLASSFDVTLADLRRSALDSAHERCGRAGCSIDVVEADLSDSSAVARVIEPADIVLGALSSAIGFGALEAVIGAGKPYCDISFMSEDAMRLDGLARERGVTAVVDCGVAPGVSNMLAGRAAAALDPCESIAIYVGGLPRERRWPFQYKAAFAPSDVIEEYTRPSRLVEGGQIVIREALTEPELLEFAGVGTLEAFNTDGLRSLVRTLSVPDMKEKTLRYPGHIELMRVFREMGLFRSEPVRVAGGQEVRPIDVTSALMFPMWSYEEGEEDLTVMRVIAEGWVGDRRLRLTWDLHDVYDREARATSMARTTALPCTIVARMLADGTFGEPGVHPPEVIGKTGSLMDRVIGELAERNVRYIAREEEI
jgi:lysine 6-dehydrogenase